MEEIAKAHPKVANTKRLWLPCCLGFLRKGGPLCREKGTGRGHRVGEESANINNI